MNKQNPWNGGRSEPSVSELLSDPIMLALLRADAVEITDLVAETALMQRHLNRKSGRPS